MYQLSEQEMHNITGKEAVTLTGILLYVGAAAAITAIIKMCTAGKGKVKLPGITLEWNS